MRDSNPRSITRLIYSQIPLAARVTRHTRPPGVITERKRSDNATRCCGRRAHAAAGGTEGPRVGGSDQSGGSSGGRVQPAAAISLLYRTAKVATFARYEGAEL